MDAMSPKPGLVKVVCAVVTVAATTGVQAQLRPSEMLPAFSTVALIDLASKSIAWHDLHGVNAGHAIRFVIDEQLPGESMVVPYRPTTSTEGRPDAFALRLASTRVSLSNGSFLRLGRGRRRGSSFSVELTY